MNTSQTSVLEQKDSDEREQAQLLVCVLDCHSLEWGARTTERFSFRTFLQHIVFFLKTYLETSSAHRVAILSSYEGPVRFLFPCPPNEDPQQVADRQQRQRKRRRTALQLIEPQPAFSTLERVLLSRVRKLHESLTEPSVPLVAPPGPGVSDGADQPPPTKLASTLSSALCYIHGYRKRFPAVTINARILVTQVTLDDPLQYRPLMNCMFCAQSMKVPIDSCMLQQVDSAWLQQISHGTSGLYIRPDSLHDGFLQYLLQVSSVDADLRKSQVQVPLQAVTDFRVTALDTRRKVDKGYVCSECLAVVAQFRFVCEVCGARYVFGRPKRRKIQASGGGGGGGGNVSEVSALSTIRPN